MKLSRRRFLACFATTALSGSAFAGSITRERFYALGAEAQITLAGNPQQARTAIAACRKEIAAIESAFSLYNNHSRLSQLNRYGVVGVDDRFSTLLQHALDMAEKTGGAFDPTIQPLWQTLLNGDDIEKVRHLIGWRNLVVSNATARFLKPSMSASLNGIAQGFAGDRVSRILKNYGYRNTLVNIGEFSAQGKKHGTPWRLGINDPVTGRIITHIEPNDSAIATSEPLGTLVAGRAHIFDPLNRAGDRWASVTVEAREAWRADALSTAIAASPVEQAASLLVAGEGLGAWLINESGELQEI